ncbi:MAG: lipoprotein LipL41 [Leptospira sp.]|nr:lipoprotein LipL41 [Leptospira sp.]
MSFAKRKVTGIICKVATIDVEYPVFPKTKEGRQLQKFIGTIRQVGLIVQKPDKGLWQQIFGESSFVDQMPSQVFAAFDKEGYYKLIDVSKRADIMNEQAFTLSGLTKGQAKLGKLLNAEAFLHIGYQKPYTECGVESKFDAGAAAAKAISIATGAKGDTGPVNKPTGFRAVLIPLDATLINTETGATMKSVVSKPFKHFGDIGITSCPGVLESFGEALEDASNQIKDRLSPKVKTEEIKIFVKDENPDVADLLKEGLEEASGETPSMKKAFENWKKADAKAKGQSAGALSNMGAYYFSIGDFDNAIKSFEKAMAVKGGDKSYFREMRKKVEATAAVDTTEK